MKHIDLEDYIDSLLAERESSDIEFKSAAGGFPGSFWETYSSFANTEGGTIVLGVKEKDGYFSVDNLTAEQIEKYKKEFWRHVNNKQVVNCNLLKNSDVIDGTYAGRPFLLFYIPMAERSQKPIYCTQNPYNGTFKRNFEGDFKCTEKEVQRMFADADESTPADSRILENYSMDDIDASSLAQYRQLFNVSKPEHPWLALDDLGLLKKLGGYRVDRKTGKEGFTLAGLLMFGKIESITDPECAPNFFPDYREIPLYADKTRWIDRIYPDGKWEANLFQFYRRVLPKLTAVLPVPFRLEHDTRIDETPLHVAIREAFINSLVHTDFSVDASIVIEQYSNQFVFSNPGTLLISRHQYFTGGESVCRNKHLQQMFLMLGKAEKAGSGVDKILRGWRERGKDWKNPLLSLKYRPDKVVLTLSMESLLPEETKMALVRYYGEEILNIGYDRLMTLSLAYSEGEICNERLRFVLDLHKADITAMLKELCQKKLLVSTGIGRGTKYHLYALDAANIESNVASKGSNIESKSLNIESNVASKSSNIASKSLNIESNVASKGTKKRLSKKQLYSLICEICEDYISLAQLSHLVNRDSQYLNNFILKDMIEKGLIERLYPNTPKHPNQKYRKK